MNKTKRLALAALAGFGLSAYGAVQDTPWWSVDFAEQTPGGAVLVEGQLGNLTNSVAYSGAAGVQPYASGVWYAIDGDESYVTNGIVTNLVEGVATEATSWHLKLDTQGNDLRWAPTSSVPDKISLVDADIMLVGSDSAPEASDFDTDHDVQTAVYLKNYTDEDDGEVTNSLLCVYVYDGTQLLNYWQELDGVELSDNSWHHVQVIVDYSGDSYAQVQVWVDGTQMHALGDTTTKTWQVANRNKDFDQLSSVSFRGTGAVDNFVGQTRQEFFDELTFVAEVYIDGVKQAEGLTGNTTRYVEAEAGDVGSGKTVTFSGFLYHDFDLENPEPPTYCLRTIVFTDFVGNTTKTLNYGYSGIDGGMQPLPETETNAVEFVTMEDPDSGEDIFYGPFHVTASTDGATDDTNLVVQIYFKTIGAYDGYATTTIGGTTTTDAKTVTAADFPDEGSTKTLTWTFDAEKDGNVLGTIQVSNGASLDYANGVATVSITLTGELTADTLYAAATYAPGSLAEGQDLRYTVEDGLYTFTPYVPPVAIIVAGNVTNEYDSLRGAVTNAVAGDTIYLLRDDHVSFSAADTEIAITKALTIDGGSNTLYGVTDYAYDGANDHDIYIGGSGDVTIKNLTLSEFSDTAQTVQYRTYPIWTGQKYGGTLVLDGVTVTNYARTAVNLSGGSFLITNCVFAGYADAATPARYYQDAVVVFNATGTVADTTVTGVGDANTGYGASVFTVNSSGAGEITVKSGSYTGGYIAAVNSNATGRITIEGGTFVATNTNGEGGKPDTAFEPANTVGKIVVTGGWFNREPEAEYLAVPYVAVEDAANAPNPAATWTVKAAAVQIEGDATKSYLSIADAAAYAETNSIADPVFVVVAPLSPETVTLTNAADALTVKTTNNVYLSDLGVVTSLESTDAVEYTVVTQTVVNTEVDPPVLTVVYAVSAQNYVAKIVDGATTNKYATFTAAATAAAAQTPTLVVEMVANTNALESAFVVEDGYALLVKTNTFLIPALAAKTRTYYLDESEPDANGVVTYTSTKYLVATFLNGDGSELDKDEYVKVGGVPRYNIDHSAVTPYPPAQPGYWVVFMNQWSPAFGAITEDTVFRPTFKTNVIEYSIQYVTNGIGNKYEGLGPHWPDGYTPPDWYAVTNADIVLPSLEMDGWVFQGWYTNATTGAGAAPVGDLVNPGVIPTGSTEPKFFYAEFAQLLNVQFTTNGVVYTNFSAVAGTTFAKPADPAVPTLEGYTFAFDGWSTNGLATGLIADGEWPQTVVRNDQTYIAMFSSNATEYAITVALNGGDWATVYTPPATYTIESAEISIPDPVQDGYEFAGWTNAAGTVVSAVIPTGSTGAQSFGATWTKLWTVTFKNGDATIYETNYLDGAEVVYVGENPTDGTKTFLGWATTAGATAALESLPNATADATYYAVFKAAEEIHVNPGDGLKDYEPEEGETVPEPIEVDSTTGKASVSFVAPAAGRYVLLSSTTVNGTYTEDAGSAKTVAQGELTTLTESSAATTKFFKIGYGE